MRYIISRKLDDGYFYTIGQTDDLEQFIDMEYWLRSPENEPMAINWHYGQYRVRAVDLAELASHSEESNIASDWITDY